MTYILSNQRDDDVVGAFARYGAYLEEHRDSFPPSAYALATSEWYYNFKDHCCPHDAWLEELVLSEPARGERQEIRTVSLRIRLLGAYHDGHVELHYPRVFRYSLGLADGAQGHRDWRYDEFRVSERGTLLHEIEWRGCGPGDAPRWVIEADDVIHTWHPRDS